MHFMEFRTCKVCEKPKNLLSFKMSQSGYRSRTCRSCVTKRQHFNNPNRFRVESAKKRQQNITSSVLQDCRSSDRKKGRIGNDLDRCFVESLITQECSYCGEKKIRITLDRKDNALAHTKSNVVPCCIRCNYLRGSMPYTAWLHIVPSIREARILGLFGDWKSKPLNKKHNLTLDQVTSIPH